jgi:Xaa-Pro aminopeptidase
MAFNLLEASAGERDDRPPNVVTRDGKAGVQTGEMVRITETGFERMHAAPPGLLRIG